MKNSILEANGRLVHIGLAGLSWQLQGKKSAEKAVRPRTGPFSGFVAPLLLLLIGSLACSRVSLGQTAVWNGGTSDWSVSGNWRGGLPTTTSTVLIDNGNAATSVVTLDVNAQVSNLVLDGDDTLSLNGFPNVNVSLNVNTATLNGTTNINSGSLLTIQSSATNNWTINLSSIILKKLTFQGEINGTGTLSNRTCAGLRREGVSD